MSPLHLRRRGAKKAAKVTAKHAVHGTTAKAKRRPVRSLVLLAVGAAIGAAITRLTAGSAQTDQPTPA